MIKRKKAKKKAHSILIIKKVIYTKKCRFKKTS